MRHGKAEVRGVYGLGYRTWAIAVYQVATSLKGVSAMKLHRELGIGYQSA